MHPFDPQACIEDALELVAPHAFAKGLHLTYQIDTLLPDVIVSDITRVRQILFNLLSNSIKFTDTRRHHRDRGRHAARIPGCSSCGSRSPTPASASRRIGSIGCSSRSARWTRRRRASTAAPAWDWRSAAAWRSCSAARSGSRASPARAAASRSPSRRRPAPALPSDAARRPADRRRAAAADRPARADHRRSHREPRVAEAANRSVGPGPVRRRIERGGVELDQARPAVRHRHRRHADGRPRRRVAGRADSPDRRRGAAAADRVDDARSARGGHIRRCSRPR